MKTVPQCGNGDRSCRRETDCFSYQCAEAFSGITPSLSEIRPFPSYPRGSIVDWLAGWFALISSPTTIVYLSISSIAGISYPLLYSHQRGELDEEVVVKGRPSGTVGVVPIVVPREPRPPSSDTAYRCFPRVSPHERPDWRAKPTVAWVQRASLFDIMGPRDLLTKTIRQIVSYADKVFFWGAKRSGYVTHYFPEKMIAQNFSWRLYTTSKLK
jgi:hypothetical protein